jgi:hypothetical protein
MIFLHLVFKTTLYQKTAGGGLTVLQSQSKVGF